MYLLYRGHQKYRIENYRFLKKASELNIYPNLFSPTYLNPFRLKFKLVLETVNAKKKTSF